jgi:DUF4097 and DUF4098 domain-containing protein YvlB
VNLGLPWQRGLAIATSAAVLVVAGGCAAVPIASAQATDSVDRSLAITGNQIEIDMFNGEITVRPGPDGAISATVTRTGVGSDQAAALADAQKIDVTLTEAAGGAVLRATYTPDPTKPDRRGASAAVTVPAGAVLVLRTSNGAVTVDGITGTALVDTSNADVIETGPMEALRAKTSNGKISVAQGGGLITLETSNGAIDVRATDATVQAATSNGAITFAGSLASGSSRMETSNSSIDVTLPSDASFGLDAQTSNAGITSDFTVSGGGSSSKDRLTGSVGAGSGTSLVLRTSNGDIHIRSGS